MDEIKVTNSEKNPNNIQINYRPVGTGNSNPK
jgi:hypothetical protein